ncbi:D-aminoacyl-tRNA deacylase [Haloprofundus salinisoli]|uniref:D-aminoacyl-tRNA deacylase n=1 Tax=Haloprofundus salinisoli TaxID=2876193 RepID=UPI001CCA5DCB|nr:D-aminoacyl-tRNA deacylase [Haloprofundus salinisoli]
MIAIVVSRADYASEHIGEHLLELADWEEHADDTRPDAEGGGTVYRTPGFELRTFEALHIYLDDPAAAFVDAGTEPDLLVFASRHSGETGPLLTAHFTGNFGPEKYGGDDRELARACPGAQKTVVSALAEHAPEGYEVGVEATHHGPTDLLFPSMFVELGSGDPQWEDTEAARAVAEAILDLRDAAASLESPGDDPNRHVVGFGGGHYAPRFGRVVRETEWAVGHVGADWQLDAMGAPEANRDVLEQAFERSDAEFALVDGEHPELEAILDELGHSVVSETWLREVCDRPLSVVSALEEELSTVEGGLRFGSRRVEHSTDVSVTEFPAELLAEAQGVDAEAVREAVVEHAVAFETQQSGTRAVGRLAVADGDDYDALVDALAAILEAKYDEVERDESDRVVRASESAFDPERAKTLGISEGPAFGKLAAGRAVEHGGERIDPEAVHVDRTVTFSY